MCIARLNVSTQTCEHRWYELSKACHPANNLANCPEKLKLEGWEARINTCPWCDSLAPKESTHRLFGSVSSASSSTSAPTTPEVGLGRSWSWRSTASAASDGAMSPLSRQSSTTSMESDWGRKHRVMNERLDIYLSYDPHEVLPSAAKNYPTYPSSQARQGEGDSRPAPVKMTSSALSKHWRKSVRYSVDKLRL